MRAWQQSLTRFSKSRERGLIAAIVLTILIAVFLVLRLQQLQIASEMRREAAMVAAKSEIQTIQAFSDYYSTVIVPRAQATGAQMTHDFTKDSEAIPFPMSMVKDVSASLTVGDRQETFRFYSNWPWKFRTDGGPRDDFETRALAELEAGQRKEYFDYFEAADGLTIRYASPIKMTVSCIDCHNTSLDSPKKDWKVGDVRGAVSIGITLPPVPALFSFDGMHWSVVGFFSIIALIVGAGLALLFKILRAQDLVARNKLSGELDHALDTARAKAQFIASMSHEFRTPLNAIIGFSEMIQVLDISSEKGKEYAGDIHQSGQHLLHLVNDILDLEKIESGKMEVEETDICLGEFLDKCISPINTIAAGRNVKVALQMDTKDSMVIADARMMRQIADNLLSNAVKFSHVGGQVNVRIFDQASGGLAVSISDQGIGIAPEVLTQLFTPFRQSDASIKRKFGGTGLGLVIVKQLLSLHGGEVALDSTLGQGTTVTMTFPAERRPNFGAKKTAA